MFQGSDEVQKPLLYDSGGAIRFTLTCLYTAVYLESFIYYNQSINQFNYFKQECCIHKVCLHAGPGKQDRQVTK